MPSETLENVDIRSMKKFLGSTDISVGVLPGSGEEIEDVEEDSSSDDDDGLNEIYSKLPEDLGFTLVGLNFCDHDLKILRNLKLDLESFLPLSEEELSGLGLKESYKIRQLMNTKHQQLGQNITSKSNETLKYTQEDLVNMARSLAEATYDVHETIQQITKELEMTPPLNYILCSELDSATYFETTCELFMQTVHTFRRKHLPGLAKVLQVTEQGEIHEKLQLAEKKAANRKNLSLKKTLVLTISIAMILALRKVIFSPNN